MRTCLTWMIAIALMLMPAAALAKVETETAFRADAGAPVLDVTTDPQNRLIFLLTAKAVLFYAVEDSAVVDQIPLTGTFDRIAFLDDEHLVLTHSASSAVEIVRFSRVYDIDLNNRIVKGPATAPVTLVVFDDYQCPYCARLEVFIEEVLAQFPNEVRFAIKHYPLENHSLARQGAMASLAAGQQGKFWEFHRKLLLHHDDVSESRILEIATELKLDLKQFNTDRQSEALQKIIREDVENGGAIGVKGTPWVFLNGKRVHPRKIGDLPDLILKELEKK